LAASYWLHLGFEGSVVGLFELDRREVAERAVEPPVVVVMTAISTQGLSQAEAARTYGLSQAWVSRLMAGYRVEGEAAFEPAHDDPRPPHPRALPVGVRDLILRLHKKLGDAGLRRT
jgi:hypothetical protein